MEPYKPRCVTDQHLAHGVRSALARAGLHTKQHNMTATSKTLVFEELRSRMYGGTLELYDVPALLSELRRLRMRHTAGASSVVNPRVGGSHGDMAQALALAVYELRHVRPGGARSVPVSGAAIDWRTVGPEAEIPAEVGESSQSKPLPGSEWKYRRRGSGRFRSGLGGFEP